MKKSLKSLTEKRENRVKKTAEVFTPQSLVNKMINKLPLVLWEEGKTFIDPACGNGNFLVEVLIRKLTLGHNPLEALKTIYGVDIMRDNIRECRERLLKIISQYDTITKEHIIIVMKNIVLAALPPKKKNIDEDIDEGDEEDKKREKKKTEWWDRGSLSYLDENWRKDHDKENKMFGNRPDNKDVERWMDDISKGNFFSEELPVRNAEEDETEVLNMKHPDLFPELWDPDIDIPEETEEENE